MRFVVSMLCVAALLALLVTAGGGKVAAQQAGSSDSKSKAAMVAVDPFKSMFIEKVPPPPPRPPEQVKECPAGMYLENLSLDHLRLVGIILTSSKSRALFQVSSGKGHIFPEGACVGPHFSRIVRIENDRVVFQEKTRDSHGEETITNREMSLRKGKPAFNV